MKSKKEIRDIVIEAGEVFYLLSGYSYEQKPPTLSVKTCERFWQELIPRKSSKGFIIRGARVTEYGYIWSGWGGRFVKLKDEKILRST